MAATGDILIWLKVKINEDKWEAVTGRLLDYWPYPMDAITEDDDTHTLELAFHVDSLDLRKAEDICQRDWMEEGYSAYKEGLYIEAAGFCKKTENGHYIAGEFSYGCIMAVNFKQLVQINAVEGMDGVRAYLEGPDPLEYYENTIGRLGKGQYLEVWSGLTPEVIDLLVESAGNWSLEELADPI